jgi:hypothetical protein
MRGKLYHVKRPNWILLFVNISNISGQVELAEHRLATPWRDCRTCNRGYTITYRGLGVS